MKTPLIAATIAIGVAACANDDQLTRNVWESNPAGSKGLLRGGELRYLQVAEIVNSFINQDVASGLHGNITATGNFTVSAKETDAEEQADLDRAIARFYSVYSGNVTTAGMIRNEIEDRIIAASNQRCGLWENYLLTSTSNVGFWSGVVGTATSAAAIAFTPTATKDALTAVSTSATDIGTEYNKAFLYGETMQVIVQGVETRRNQMLTSIHNAEVVKGNVTSIAVYSLSAGIADALAYHGACSMASGLQAASEALSDQRPPSGNATGNLTGNATREAVANLTAPALAHALESMQRTTASAATAGK